MVCAVAHSLLTSLAIEKWRAFADAHQGNEKDAEIVIHLLKKGLMQSTIGTAPSHIVNNSGLGLDSPDEKKHAPTPPQTDGKPPPLFDPSIRFKRKHSNAEARLVMRQILRPVNTAACKKAGIEKIAK